MKRLALLAALLVGCSRDPGMPAPASQAQAVVLPTMAGELAPATDSYPSGFMDTPWPQLGTSLSACPQGGFVSGGGDFFAVFTVDSMGTTAWRGTGATAISLGRSVVCIDDEHWVGGGADGTYRDGDPNPLLYQPTFALTPYSNGILAGAAYQGDVGCVFVLNDAGVEPVLCGDGGSFGQAIAVNEDTPQIAVASPQQDKVELFERDGGVLFLAATIDVPGPLLRGSGFGSTLAYGDISAAPGRELLIGSGNGVYVFSEAQRLVMKLELATRAMNPVSDGPPFSIVVERGLFANWPVRHFWLGLPSSDLVFRCIGTSCDAFSLQDVAVTGTGFGASLAIDGNTLLVGAPGWANGGAVFAFSAQFPHAPDGGFALECTDTGKECGCGFDCVGSVFCLPDIAAVCSDGGVDAGVDAGSEEKDAGVNDAGVTDAGSGKDGGAVDSGTVDAGIPDGGSGGGAPGSADFIAQGCSSSAAFPLVLLGLFALRRRNSLSPGERVSRSEG